MSASAPRAWRLLRRILLSLPFLVVVGLIAAYVAFGYLAVGPLAAHYIPKLAQSQLDSRATLGKVAFDPLRLDVTVDDFQLATPQGVPLAGFKRLVVDFAPSSLWHWAWTFHQIRLEQPQVNIAIAQGGAMNWDGVVRALQRGAKPSKPSDTIPRVVIEQLRIAAGVLRYADADRSHPYVTQLAPLNVQIDALSTLPKARGDYAISLVLPEQKATLRWKGYVGLNPLVSGGQAELTGLDLAAAAHAIPDLARTAQIVAGTANLHAAYSAVLGKSGLLWAVNDAGAQVQGLRAKTPAATFQWHDLTLAQARFDGSTRNAALQAITLDGLQMQAGASDLRLQSARLQGGQLDWAAHRAGFGPLRLQGLSGQVGQVALQADALQTQPGQADLTGPTLQLPQLLLRELRLQPLQGAQAAWLQVPTLQIDAVRADGSQHRLQVGAVQLDAARLQLKRLADGRIDLLQALGAAAPATASKPSPAVTPPTQAAAWTVDVQRIATRLQALDYTDQSFRQPMQLQLHTLALDTALQATVAAGHAPQVHVKDLRLQSGALHLDSAGKPLARWAALRLGPTTVALPATGAPRIQAGPLEIDALHADVALRPGGLNWAQAFQPRATAAPAAARATSPAGMSADVQLQSVNLRQVSARIDDSTGPAPLRLDVVRGQMRAQHLSLDLRKPVPLQLQFAVAQGGTFSAQGRIAPQPLAGTLRVRLDQLALTPFGVLLQPYVRLLLTSGTASADGSVQLRHGQGALPLVRYDGSAQVDNLALVEPEGRTPFLGWRKLAASGLQVDSAPLAVSMTVLHAVEPYGRIVLNPNRTLNVQAILLTRKAVAVPAPSTKAAETAPLPLQLRIQRTAIENADVDFTDQSIKPDFRVRMQKLSGVINGLSDAPDSSAQIELDGQVDAYGQAKVRGRLQPFRATHATDVTLDLRNLDLASVSPYSGKFAGRTIESGRLDAKLDYKIQKAQMQGDNQFTITRLKLGPHVDSPDAVNLPLDLAIAVLENSQGVIDINLPVHGDLDNPKFSYGGIIWQAIVNVLTKVVTAPFRALGALFGGSGDAQPPQAVVFAPGSAVLSPPQREKLAQLAQALLKRPRLDLQVPPTVDPARDTAALQDTAVRRQVLGKLGVVLPPDAHPGPLDLGDARTRHAIDALYLEQHPTSARDALSKALPKDAAAHALWHAMLQQLASAVVIPQSALDALAQARARAVVTALTTGAPALPAARVQIGAAAPSAAQAETPGNDDKADTDVVLQLGLRAAALTAAPAPASSVPSPSPAR